MKVKDLKKFNIIRDGRTIQLTADEIDSLIKQYEKELYDERLEFIEEEIADEFEDEDFDNYPEAVRERAIKRVAKEILGYVEDGFTTLADALDEWTTYIPYFDEEDLKEE